ncbi:hypothetical protein Neosp_010056 [[Neocosmospora] mangrovei]
MGFWKGVFDVVGSILVVGHTMACDKAGTQKSATSSLSNPIPTVGAIGGFFVGGAAEAVGDCGVSRGGFGNIVKGVGSTIEKQAGKAKAAH